MNVTRKFLFRAALLALLVVGGTVLVGCQSTDVVAKQAVTSFATVAENSNTGSDQNEVQTLTAPDGSSTFSWGPSTLAIATDVAPFVAAGLDTNKLPEGFTLEGETLQLAASITTDEPAEGENGMLTAIVEQNRDLLGYHDALGHFGFTIQEGSMFEWAKDAQTNDKDIVWVLNPEPFIEAGVDVANVEGWVFAKVEVMMDGKKVEVDKLLKPFDVVK